MFCYLSLSKKLISCLHAFYIFIDTDGFVIYLHTGLVYINLFVNLHNYIMALTPTPEGYAGLNFKICIVNTGF